ncbi:hypothetical protein JTE90_007144 [Oedothorax gibbosus]|uniref:Uncharacterized protein n=1 Tax=Oedothorax gibbosus TaxID=931172 RepID=A0AAV6TGS8_9ARAC|nr:hypothetical protein JTE90_007144 [Oedothorax gibbosus]
MKAGFSLTVKGPPPHLYYTSPVSSQTQTIQGLRPETKINTISSDFQRANRGAPDTARDAVFLREQRPYLRTSRFPGTRTLQRKDNSSPGPPSTPPSFGCVTALGPEGPISVSGLGNINPFPFGRQRDKHEACVCVWADAAWEKGFSPTPFKNPLTHVKMLFTWNPSPASVLKVSFLVFATTTKICTGGGSGAGSPRPLQRTPPRPSYSLRVNLTREALPKTARYRPNVELPHFRG